MLFLTLNFWFDRVPNQDPVTLKVYFVLFLSLVIIGAVVRLVTKRSQKDRYAREVSRRLATFFVVMGVLGLIYWFFAFERLPFLSSRFWLPGWLIGALYWVYAIVHYATRTAPKERERLHAHGEDRKYLRDIR